MADQVDIDPEDSCVICNKQPARRCSQCKSTYYCSSDCQKKDFSSHKLLCKQFADQAERPSPKHKRAIFFPADRAKPQMIWVPTAAMGGEDEYDLPWTMVEPNPYLGPGNPIPGNMRSEYNAVRDRTLGSGFTQWAEQNKGHCVTLICRDNYLSDGSNLNMSIYGSIGGGKPTPHVYRGPMIGMRQLPGESYGDITLADFRHLIDFFTSYGSPNPPKNIPNDTPAPNAVRGVKICCDGHMNRTRSKNFVSVKIPGPIKEKLGSGAISPISTLLGMPVEVWKIPDESYQRDPDPTADSNPYAAFLMLDADPASQGWGWAPPYWNREIGNVLVCRKDGKDLTAKDVSMMCYFSRHTLQDMFENTLELGPNSPRKLKVRDFITWENMYNEYKSLRY